MVDKIQKTMRTGEVPKTAEKQIPSKSLAENIFAKMDKNGDKVVTQNEANMFGFTTLGNNPLSLKDFSEKFSLFRDKTSNINRNLNDYEDIFYRTPKQEFMHDVTLTKKQQQELLSRFEMFDAYFSTLSKEQQEELLKIKSDMMCFNWFREDRPVPDDYELPKDSKKDTKSLKGLPDYKYVQIREFLNGDYKKLKAELRECKEGYKISNAMLAKYLKFSEPTELDSDGKISGFRQGSVGDCWFLSSLNSYASTPDGEKNIKERIKKNDDGSYTVSFNNPFDQMKKETYTVTAEELSNYRKIEKDPDENKKEFSSGDIDVRILEIATNKLFEKYLTQDQIYRPNDLPIEGSSYLKESLVHKALGYKGTIEYYYRDNDSNSPTFGKILGEENEILLGQDGKAKADNQLMSEVFLESFLAIINHNENKVNEFTCGTKAGAVYKNEADSKFMRDQHGYNIMRITDNGVVVSNPHYSGFPHIIPKESFNGSFFDILVHIPQYERIPISDCKD